MLLQTRRLVLRRFHERDAVALAEYRSEPEVAVELRSDRRLIGDVGVDLHDNQ